MNIPMTAHRRELQNRLRAPQIAGEEVLYFGPALAASAARNPSKIAVIDGDVALDWAEFYARAARVAGQLAARGFGRGDMVAGLSENSSDYLTLYCGVLLSGACMVPLPQSAALPALKKMRADCGAALLFTSAAQREVADQLGAEEVVDLAALTAWAGEEAIAAPADVAPDDLFDMIYSSGTTGTPKGIAHDHRFRARQLTRMPAFGLDGEAVLMMSTPLYSNTTLVAALPVLAAGGTVVSMPKFNAGQFLELSQAHRVSHAMLVPVQYMRLMDHPDFDQYDLSAFRAKMSTSAPLPGKLIERILARWPGELFEVYGMTEGGVSTVLNCRENPTKLDTVGMPAEGCDVRIIDEEGRELPPTEYGEIVGRSGSMMPGYYNAQDKTDEILWRDAQGNDFIRTGDMGRFDEDGFLQLLDRRKDMIISGGFNIYATDLEQVLRAHPAVADVAVIAIPSQDWGETPLGLVVRKAGASDSAEEICAAANAQLGKTQRLSAVELREDLPRSEIGKILKRELRDEYWPKA